MTDDEIKQMTYDRMMRDDDYFMEGEE